MRYFKLSTIYDEFVNRLHNHLILVSYYYVKNNHSD